MIITTLSALTLSISLAILNAYTPLSLGFWIIILALSIALLTTSSTFSWFGFIIFLIYIGGMLVIFAYFIAIQPNQQLNISLRLSTLFITIALSSFILPFNHLSHSPNQERTWITTLIRRINTPTLILLGLVLFLALLAVVKISSAFLGPLRPYSYV